MPKAARLAALPGKAATVATPSADARDAAKAAAPAESFLNPLSVAQALDQCLEPGAIIVADGGDFVGTASYIVRPDGPLTWLE